MTDHELPEAIAAAHAYEGLHVPALFQEWTEPMLDAANVHASHRVLDVACGTGVLARAAKKRVGPDGTVAGIDPNPGMLGVAERLEPTVAWKRGTAEELPFPDGAFDAVVSQFGMMFFTDRHRAVEEMLRVLAPDGTVAVAVWDALENSPAYGLEVDLLQRLAGPAAADALRAPFVLGDRDELALLFQRAGAMATDVVTRTGTARFPSVRTMVEADLRGWLPVMGVVLEEELIERILLEAERVLEPFVAEDGEVVFPSPGHIVVAS